MTDMAPMKVKRSSNAISRVIDGEVVVLLPDEGTIHALKGCGGRVWELTEQEMPMSEIVQKVCAEYEVEPQIAREEIDKFLRKLAAMKLVEIVPAEKEVTC